MKFPLNTKGKRSDLATLGGALFHLPSGSLHVSYRAFTQDLTCECQKVEPFAHYLPNHSNILVPSSVGNRPKTLCRSFTQGTSQNYRTFAHRTTVTPPTILCPSLQENDSRGVKPNDSTKGLPPSDVLRRESTVIPPTLILRFRTVKARATYQGATALWPRVSHETPVLSPRKGSAKQARPLVKSAGKSVLKDDLKRSSCQSLSFIFSKEPPQ